MKKLLAIVLSMLLMFSANARQDNIRKDNETLHLKVEQGFMATDLQKHQEPKLEDGKISIEILTQIASWEELQNTVIPISEIDASRITNKEDWYCVLLIQGISETKTVTAYHNMEYVAMGLGSISIKEVDYDRLLTKFQRIIGIYNSDHELKLSWTVQIVNEQLAKVEVNSINLTEIDNPIEEIGQKVEIKQGTLYWESAYDNGSGQYGIATDSNPYIPRDFIVTVNAVAYYTDENRTTVGESVYVDWDELGNPKNEIKLWKFHMLHICTQDTDLGWVYPEDLILVE